MYHGGDELDFLLHSLGQFFHAAVPPRVDAEPDEPLLQAAGGLLLRQSAQACQVDDLLRHFHLFVEATFLRQVADVLDILRFERVAVKQHLAAVGHGDMGENSDKGGFARAIGTEQTKDAPFRNSQRKLV